MIDQVQGWIWAILALVGFVLQVWAVIDCARARKDEFVAAGKRTKTFWLVIVAIAAAIGFASLPWPLGGGSGIGFLNLIAIVAASVYLADVRPALKEVRANSRRY